MIGLINLQSGHALQLFEKAVSEPVVDVKIAAQKALRNHHDEHDDHRNQRNREEQQGRCSKIDRGQHKEQGERRKQGVKELA